MRRGIGVALIPELTFETLLQRPSDGRRGNTAECVSAIAALFRWLKMKRLSFRRIVECRSALVNELLSASRCRVMLKHEISYSCSSLSLVLLLWSLLFLRILWTEQELLLEFIGLDILFEIFH